MSDSWMQYNATFNKKTNIRNSITENQQHYDRKIVQFKSMSMSFSTSSSSFMLKKELPL